MDRGQSVVLCRPGECGRAISSDQVFSPDQLCLLHLEEILQVAVCQNLDNWNVDLRVTLEQWNVFRCTWNAFMVGSSLDPKVSSAQLVQCVGDALEDVLLQSDSDIKTHRGRDGLCEGTGYGCSCYRHDMHRTGAT